MKLEIQSIEINNLVAGSKTYANKKDLFIDLNDLENHLLEDPCLATVELKIIHKDNDNTRIVKMIDAFQPRCKLEGGTDFPGYIGEIETAGKGVTRSLDNIVVLACDKSYGRGFHRFIDTGGPVAKLSRYSNMNILYVSGTPSENTNETDFSHAIRTAGIKASIYMAKHAETLKVDKIELYDLELSKQPNPNGLPKICYYYQLHAPHYDHKGIPKKILYGQSVLDMTPSIYHPNEILDGAVSGGSIITTVDTFTNQNHAIVKELYRRHQNKEIIFCGVVGGVLSMNEIYRRFSVKHSAKLIKEVLGADGVVLTKYTGGAAHLDAGMVAKECEDLGVGTAVHITPFTATGNIADNLVYFDDCLDLIITAYAYFDPIDVQFKAEELLGGFPEDNLGSDLMISEGKTVGDEFISVEQVYIAGFAEMYGGSSIKVVDY